MSRAIIIYICFREGKNIAWFFTVAFLFTFGCCSFHSQDIFFSIPSMILTCGCRWQNLPQQSTTHHTAVSLWRYFLCPCFCTKNIYLLVYDVPFLAKGAVRILHRVKNHMTDQKIYFSGLTRFVHTCLGLICENLIIFYKKGDIEILFLDSKCFKCM